MSNRGYRRRPRKRITGRFYAFLTVVVVVVVFVGVLVNNQGSRAPQPANVIAPVPQNSPVIVSAAQPSAAQPTVAPAAVDPVAEPEPQAADPAAAPADTTGSTSGVSSISDLLGGQDEAVQVVDEADKAQVDASSLSVTQGLPSEWRNILLLGSDSRNVDKVSRTDTIMIASVNANNGKVRLVSIMRDLVVPFTNNSGQTKEVKINSLIGRGGTNRVMQVINQLFNMNITEYVMVNFASFQKVVDILGGVDIDITQDEMDEINVSLGEMAKAAGYEQDWYLANKDSLTLKTYGAQTHLNGIQALGFARIRHLAGADYRRTERQRDLLDAILRKVKNDANVVQMMQLATSMWGEISTNIDFGSAVGLATTVIKNGAVKINDSWRIPGTSTSFKSETRSSLGYGMYDCDFDANAQLLYKFIYENDT